MSNSSQSTVHVGSQSPQSTQDTPPQDTNMKSTQPTPSQESKNGNGHMDINSNTSNKNKSNDEYDEKKSMYDVEDTMHLNGFEEKEFSKKKSCQPARNPIELVLNLDTIDDKYLRETQKIYYAQCKSLDVSDAKQKALFKLAAIGRQNNNYPLLLNLIDCYLRDRLENFISNPLGCRSITEQDWCNNYKIVKKLTSKLNSKHQAKLKDIIESAIKTYFRRYCQPIMLPTSFKISDSIKSFIQCIHEIGGLILAIKQNPIEILPFQIDLVIIPQDVIDINNESDSEAEPSFDDSQGSSEETEESDEYEPIPNVNKRSNEIGNIELRLKSNEIKYEHDIKPKMEREFRQLYRKYTQSVTSPTIKNKRHALDVDNTGTDLQRFPHKKRLCIVVDRRLPAKDVNNNNSDNDNKKENEDEQNQIYLFEPPLCNKMPNNHIREWYIESSYKCIIPGFKKQAITSKSSLDGWINTFSFHIEQEDEIRCYFYRSGQILRFMPQDIKDLFEHLFVLTKFNNRKFIQGNDIKQDIKRMQNTWRDIHFDKFRQVLLK